jgi:hypothetical protein
MRRGKNEEMERSSHELPPSLASSLIQTPFANTPPTESAHLSKIFIAKGDSLRFRDNRVLAVEDLRFAKVRRWLSPLEEQKRLLVQWDRNWEEATK